MSLPDQIDQSRKMLARARHVADQLDQEAAESAKKAGYGPDNTLRYPWMLGHVTHNAGRRIAELEAWITANGLRLPDEILAEALAETTGQVVDIPLARDGREAASHAERGRR